MTDTTEARWEQHNEAGRAYFAKGEFAQAEHAFIAAIREATTLGADNLRLAASLSSLGQLKYKQRDFPQAEALFRRSLAIRERVQGPDHYSVVQNINNLAALHFSRGELDLAEPLFLRALAISEKHLGADHADVAVCLNNLARLYFRRNDFTAAAPLLMRLLAIREHALGSDHPEVAGILSSLVKVRFAEGQHDAAEQLARRVLAIRERTASPNDQVIATALDALAEIYAVQQKFHDELETRERALAIRESAGGDPAAIAYTRDIVQSLRVQIATGKPFTRPVRTPPRAAAIPTPVATPAMPAPWITPLSPATSTPAVPSPSREPRISTPPSIERAAAAFTIPSPSDGAVTITAERRTPFTPSSIEVPKLVGVSADMFATAAEPQRTPTPGSYTSVSDSTPEPAPAEFISLEHARREADESRERVSHDVTAAPTGLERNRWRYAAAIVGLAAVATGAIYYARSASAKDGPRQTASVASHAAAPSTSSQTASNGQASGLQSAQASGSIPTPPPSPAQQLAARPASSSSTSPSAASASATDQRTERTPSASTAASSADPALPKVAVSVDPSRLGLDRIAKEIDDSARKGLDSTGRAIRLQNPTFEARRPNVISRRP